MDGKGHQPHADVGVEALDGLHETHRALLDEVGLSKTVTVVAPRHPHHEAQMREHQTAGRIQVVMAAIALRQLALLLDREHGDAVHRLDVGIQRADGQRRSQFVHHR